MSQLVLEFNPDPCEPEPAEHQEDAPPAWPELYSVGEDVLFRPGGRFRNPRVGLIVGRCTDQTYTISFDGKDYVIPEGRVIAMWETTESGGIRVTRRAPGRNRA